MTTFRVQASVIKKNMLCVLVDPSEIFSYIDNNKKHTVEAFCLFKILAFVMAALESIALFIWYIISTA